MARFGLLGVVLLALVLPGCRTRASHQESAPEMMVVPVDSVEPSPAEYRTAGEPDPPEADPAPPPEPPSLGPDEPRAAGSAPSAQATGSLTASTETVSAAGKRFTVRLIEAPLGSYRVCVGLAHDEVGRTESLGGMAQRQGAVAAINGCFFDAYSSRKVRNPYGLLIVDGEVVHLSDHPTAFGVWPDGSAAIGQVKFRVSGSLDGQATHPNNWYAYGLNSYPDGKNWAEIYTPLWGAPTCPGDGRHVVVRGGEVTAVGYGAATIPEDGYVLYMRGQETYMVDRFSAGRQCEFECQIAEAEGSVDWTTAVEALGCGPLLVREEKVSVDPAGEGFRDPKVLNLSCSRSALGLTSEGCLLLATCPGATMRQLAEVMKELGCREAMNLDGGASSGLWLRGQYLTRPGREIANALLVMEGDAAR